MVLQKNCCTKKRKSTEVTVAAISADSKCQRLQRSTYNGCQQARDDAVFAPALRPEPPTLYSPLTLCPQPATQLRLSLLSNPYSMPL